MQLGISWNFVLIETLETRMYQDVPGYQGSLEHLLPVGSGLRSPCSQLQQHCKVHRQQWVPSHQDQLRISSAEF